MAFEAVSEWASHFSIQEVLNGDFSFFVPFFYLIISIAIYSVLIWHFYRFIARRDCFHMSYMRHSRAVMFMKYCFIFPVVAILFFAGFSLLILFLTKSYAVPDALSTSFAVVVAIRITAYYNEDLSKDVAKMLPFALLGVFLVDPSYFEWADVVDKMDSIPEFVTLCVQFVLLIILVEWILRLVLIIKRAILPPKANIVVEEQE